MAAREVLCVLVVLFAVSYCVNMFKINKDEYLSLRNNILHKEYEMRTGGKIKLSDAERRVNDTLMKLKAKELDIARTNTTNFPPAVHFFRAKALIDKSEVFNIIRNMPKGKHSLHSIVVSSSSSSSSSSSQNTGCYLSYVSFLYGFHIEFAYHKTSGRSRWKNFVSELQCQFQGMSPDVSGGARP